MEYTAAGQGYVNAEGMRHIDDVRLVEMNEDLRRAHGGEYERGVEQVARQILEAAAVTGGQQARKTMLLAGQALNEMNEEGRVSRKTMLALDDNARKAEMPR